MIVMVDNNFLISLLQNPSDYRLFVQKLEYQKHQIGLPTPVLAEFLVRDENLERELFLSKVNGFLQIFSFDIKSAQMSSHIMRELLKIGFFDNKSKDKQVIKVDIQILGIILANQIQYLYTADKEIIKIVELLRLPIQILHLEES